jgi:hypothetical protein
MDIYDTLIDIAGNLRAEGQTGRAELVDMAADEIKKTKDALSNLLSHVEMIQVTGGFEMELDMEPFDIKAAMRQAADTLGVELIEDMP